MKTGLHLFGYVEKSVFITCISPYLQYNRYLAEMFHVKGQLCAFTFFNTRFKCSFNILRY